MTFLSAYSDPNETNCYNRIARRLYYTPGEDFTVTANMLDGTTVDVTNICEYSPEGATNYSNPVWQTQGTIVTATYTSGNTVSTTIDFPNNYSFAPYTITPPTKLSYRVGEALDFSGADFLSGFTYTNGDLVSSDYEVKIKEQLITGDVIERYRDNVPDPQPGEIPNNSTGYFIDYIVKQSTSRIYVTQNLESGDSVTAYFDITVATLRSITLTPPAKTTYSIGENIDYSGIVITANYSDGSSDDVTADIAYSIEEGTTVTADTPTRITVSYTNIGGETATASFSITIHP